MIGTIAERYLLEQELGRGGMATVYRARDQRLGRAVAVKVMHPSLPASSRERFRREAEIVASLKHRNVLEVHDVGEDPALGPWLVTELVEGESLRGLFQRVGPLSPVAAAALGWELAEALAAAHARGVVHRDVKPENVLLSKDGRLKLADFGIAALHDQQRLTSTGAVTGSLAYMAPERLDDGSFSPASDVYSLGVMIFELCAGRTPFKTAGAAQLAAAVLTKEPPRLHEVAPHVPEALSALVARCLSRDPRTRFEDGAAVAKALEAFVREDLGSAADASRAFLSDPAAQNERLRDRDFDRLLARAKPMLAAGQGARAARLLDAALLLRPGSEEVKRLLLQGPQQRRRRTRVLAWSVAAAFAAAGTFAGVFLWSASEKPAAVVVAAPREELTPPAAKVEPVVVPPVVEEARPTPPPPALAKKKQQVPPPPPTVEPPQAPSTLTLSTRPWAEVFVDGRSVGYTPAVRTLELAPGTHVLRLQNPHCEPHEESLVAAGGKALSRDVSLTLRKAGLVIRAPAGSKLYVNGVEVGTAPLIDPVRRDHGKHTVSAILPDGARVTQDVKLVAGEDTRVELEGG